MNHKRAVPYLRVSTVEQAETMSIATQLAVIERWASASGAGSIADPRHVGARYNNVFRVVDYAEASPAVTAGAGPGGGGLAVADPRTPRELAGETAWRGGGPYGVVPWGGAAGAVTASADAASGVHSAADPRPLPAADALGVWVVISPHGGAWHRPFTTLDLAALQSLVTEADLEAIAAGDVTGPASLATRATTDTRRRQWIGNAVPRATARAIGCVILKALLAAEVGESFALSSSAPWAIERRLAAGLSVEVPT
jgi:site-specific DNA-cytosine methylase